MGVAYGHTVFLIGAVKGGGWAWPNGGRGLTGGGRARRPEAVFHHPVPEAPGELRGRTHPGHLHPIGAAGSRPAAGTAWDSAAPTAPPSASSIAPSLCLPTPRRATAAPRRGAWAPPPTPGPRHPRGATCSTLPSSWWKEEDPRGGRGAAASPRCPAGSPRGPSACGSRWAAGRPTVWWRL